MFKKINKRFKKNTYFTIAAFMQKTGIICVLDNRMGDLKKLGEIKRAEAIKNDEFYQIIETVVGEKTERLEGLAYFEKFEKSMYEMKLEDCNAPMFIAPAAHLDIHLKFKWVGLYYIVKTKLMICKLLAMGFERKPETASKGIPIENIFNDFAEQLTRALLVTRKPKLLDVTKDLPDVKKVLVIQTRQRKLEQMSKTYLQYDLIAFKYAGGHETFFN